MNGYLKLVAATAACVAGIVSAQTTTDTPRDGRTAGEVTRDTANAVGRAASAAVTPGDQNLGRNPNNRSGGLMGNERDGTGGAADAAGRAGRAAVTPGDQNMGQNPGNRSGGLMGTDRSGSNSDSNSRRPARADRG